MAARKLILWDIVWSPEGRTIAQVWATTARAAKAQTPAPYSRYKGEVYVREAV
jgi:hypothetical protein